MIPFIPVSSRLKKKPKSKHKIKISPELSVHWDIYTLFHYSFFEDCLVIYVISTVASASVKEIIFGSVFKYFVTWYWL